MEKIDGGQVRRVLRDALDIWAKNSKLTFREVYDERADIQVMFAKGHHGDGYDFDGPGSILAHAFYPGTGRGGDAHFDSDEIWHVDNRDTNDGTNLMGVAVHEFGHSLGLGHSDVQNSIMFPWYQGYDHNKDLPDDDRYGIQALYGAKYKQWASVNVPYNRPTRPITTTTTTTMKSLVFHPDRNDPRYNYNRNNEEEKRKREREERERQRERERKERERKERERKEREREERERIERERKERERIERERQRQREIEREREREREREYEREREREKEREREYEARRTYHNNRGHHHPHHISTTKRPFNYPNTQGPTTRYQHPKYHTTSMTPIKPRVVHPNYLPVKPDTCNTDYDAISMIRGELFIFKDKYLWRVRNGFPEEGYPYRIDRIFKFPQHEEFSHVDAVYENKQKKIVFFIGKKYYVFNSNTLEPNYPKPLTNLGLPDTLDKIDAALVWGHNNRTYFYSGTLYWRFDEDVEKVELDYPRDMSIWAGIGYHINAAFQYTNGKTYFFKGKTYWEFNDDRMRVAHIRPKPSAHKWMHCPREQDSPNNSKQNYEEEHYFIERNLALISAEHNNANSSKFNLITLIISLLLGILFSNTKIL
ncbi:matrix metalloproteinase-2-like [Condylostylus longicornis]|uniref:matrix metalloproteinase-2-like n=1 Tax=Condylostylus longicornis TaxID=2530218 RepID=UPI00244E4D29|nr:matrix metalloproteinase-2-like [Condylostylus longicornis]